MNFNTQKPDTLTSVVFKATKDDSRIDDKATNDLSIKDICAIDDKLWIGRAPGKASYGSKEKAYDFDSNALLRDIEFLSKSGVDTIIDFRNPKYESSECIDAEREACEIISRRNNTNINYISIPLDSAIVPTDAELQTFFDAIQNSKRKVYIHCHAGKDRTGIMASCYLAKQYKMEQEDIFKKIFDLRKIQRLYYMSNHPEQCKKFFEMLKNLTKL